METSSQKPSFGQGLELTGLIAKAIANVAKKTNIGQERLQEIIEKPGTLFKLIEDLFIEDNKLKKSSRVLKIVSGAERMVIEALDGQLCIPIAKKIFGGFISDKFGIFGLNNFRPATKETSVEISQVIKKSTTAEVFNSITPELDKLVLTQHQVIRFCEKYPDWYNNENSHILFLTKNSRTDIDEYFVISVSWSCDALQSSVWSLNYGNINFPEFRVLVAYPQFLV